MSYSKSFVRNGSTFPYDEDLDDEGYVYGISVIWEDRQSEVWITNDAVSISFEDDGSVVTTNICPESLFKTKKSLTEDQLYAILETLSAIDLEGKIYSDKEIRSEYQRYLRQREE